jgi:hypothetical protein
VVSTQSTTRYGIEIFFFFFFFEYQQLTVRFITPDIQAVRACLLVINVEATKGVVRSILHVFGSPQNCFVVRHIIEISSD